MIGLGVHPVDGGPQAAHEDQPALQMPLEGGDVVLRQHALPHLDADLSHVVHDGRQVRVGVVDGDDPAGADIAVEPAVGLLENLPDMSGFMNRAALVPQPSWLKITSGWSPSISPT